MFNGVKSVLERADTVARMKKDCQLIDSAGPAYKVYQVTVSGLMLRI
jgi:hypothetical protein